MNHLADQNQMVVFLVLLALCFATALAVFICMTVVMWIFEKVVNFFTNKHKRK